MDLNNLLHYVCLRTPAGVEKHFLEFANEIAVRYPAWTQTVLATGGSIHPHIRQELNRRIATVHEKYAGSVKLPKHPRVLRRWRNCLLLKRLEPELVVVWNRPSRAGELLRVLGGRRWLYWEHGAAWHSDYEEARRAFYRAAPFVIANSHAALRMMQLKWQIEAPAEVCLNALRPSLKPQSADGKTCSEQRRFRLGAVSRLIPLKGGPLVLHALKQITDGGLDAELHIAGAGYLRKALEDLAGHLGVAERVIWHGLVQDMSGFYQTIDCLLHPALHEPFGLVAIEAAAHGCPVIAAAVDGLPEAVRDGETGYCIQPDLPLSAYDRYGGSATGVPKTVYDPATDTLIEPRFVEPGEIAQRVLDLVSDPVRYQDLSRSAIAGIDRYYDFTAHTRKVADIFAGITAGPACE